MLHRLRSALERAFTLDEVVKLTRPWAMSRWQMVEQRFGQTTDWQVLRPASHRAYSSSMTFHALPRFGSVKLRDLRRETVQEWVDDLAVTHSPQTAREAHKAFRRVLQGPFSET